MDTGRIVVRRPRGWADRVWSYPVEVDGQPVGVVRAGRSLVLDVPAGARTVLCRHHGDRSPAVTVDVQPGRAVTLVMEPRPLRDIWRGGTGASRYLKLYRDAMPTETAPSLSVQCLQFTGDNHEQVAEFLAGQQLPEPVKAWNWIVKQPDGTVAQHTPQEFLALYDPA